MPSDVLRYLHDAADAAVEVLSVQTAWGPSGQRDTQYLPDLATDAAIRVILMDAGFGLLSEESGATDVDADIVVVVDPLDGSTNASKRIGWYATSLCAVDSGGLLASVVHDHGSGDRFAAERGIGATKNGQRLRRTGAPALAESIVGISGLPPKSLGWGQFRAFGASALDICAVADGRLDAFVDCSHDAHGAWDYLGAMLICAEAGVVIADALGRDLVVLDYEARRTPVAAASTMLLDALVANRRAAFGS